MFKKLTVYFNILTVVLHRLVPSCYVLLLIHPIQNFLRLWLHIKCAISMEDTSEDATSSVNSTVVSLLNDASASHDTTYKLENLRKVQELILFRDTALLDNFLDEVLGFQHDPSPDIKKFLLSFTVAACRKDPDIITKVVANLGFFLADENANVRKKVIVAVATIYPLALKWVAKKRSITNEIEQTWEYLVQLKGRLVMMLDDDNDGIRTYIVKFLEACVLAQSCKSASSQLPLKGENGIAVSLDQVPRDHRLISYRRLEAESKNFFQKLLDMIASQHVTSVNLMTCMAALSNIARQRPDFMEKVVLSYETLHVNLPPTLSKSQVSSVRKALKQHLLALLKHSASISFHPQMTTLLTDLGATQLQVIKSLPVGSELRKRIRKVEEGATSTGLDNESTSKRQRLGEIDDEEPHDEAISLQEDTGFSDADERQREENAIDNTAEYLLKKLTTSNVVDLVLLSMVKLPQHMPPQFQSSFTPIAAAGTEAQIRHLARLMATQLTALGFGPGAEFQKAKQIYQLHKQQHAQKSEINKAKNGGQILKSNLETSSTASDQNRLKKAQSTTLMPAGVGPGLKTSKRFHQFGLAHITKPMDPEANQRMMVMAFERIMNAEKRVINGGASTTHMKLLVSIASEFDSIKLFQSLQEFILSDQKSRADLAMLWIFYEYCSFRKYLETLEQADDKAFEKYDRCLSSLLANLLARGEHRESLFHKILLEAPLITPNALDILKRACLDPSQGSLGLSTLREMVLTRPKQRDEILCTLINFTCFENIDLRHQALEICKELYLDAGTRTNVFKDVVGLLQNLVDSTPPDTLFGINYGRPENPGRWEEDAIKASLNLFLYLLPLDFSLIMRLADVYSLTSNDIRRVILRLIEGPIRLASGHNPDIMAVIENFPTGSETLIMKIVNLLTERSAPTLELIRCVRKLYHERVPDVRFLIPVLSSLQKKEIIAALPKLIRLNTNVVKEVFVRLLHGRNVETSQQLSPIDLMIALGQMEFSTTEEAKPIIAALDMLTADKAVYTKEILATVIQSLAELSPLPTLLMRLVLQSLNQHSSLLGFVVSNLLPKLVFKEIWTQPKVWEGFVRCCLKTRPHSFQVMLLLPAVQLKNLFDMAPDARLSVLNYVDSLSSAHQGSISEDVRQVLYPVDTTTVQAEPVVLIEQPSASSLNSKVDDDLSIARVESSAMADSGQTPVDPDSLDTTPMTTEVVIKKEIEEDALSES